jgi:hypothetical protein
MLKIPAEYGRDTSPDKLTGISLKISPASLLMYLLVFARELWSKNHK